MNAAGTLRHDALLYEDRDHLFGTLVPFVRDGLDAGDAVVAVLPVATGAALRAALGADAGSDRLELLDAAASYRQPVRTIAEYHRSLRGRLDAGHRHLRVVGELTFGTDPAVWAAWTRYEAAVNRAFADVPAWMLCLYDAGALPPTLVADAARTHPQVHTATGCHPSPAYEPPEQVVASLVAVPTPPDRPALTLTVTGNLQAARAALGRLAGDRGVDRERTAELALAVDEVLANAVLHGGGRAELRVWCEPGSFVCEVADDGHGAVDPLAGYLPPDIGRCDGRGLWIARQLVDHVELVRRPGGGLSVWLQAGLIPVGSGPPPAAS